MPELPYLTVPLVMDIWGGGEFLMTEDEHLTFWRAWGPCADSPTCMATLTLICEMGTFTHLGQDCCED